MNSSKKKKAEEMWLDWVNESAIAALTLCEVFGCFDFRNFPPATYLSPIHLAIKELKAYYTDTQEVWVYGI